MRVSPWGLSEQQARTMDVFIEHGCPKLVCRQMDISLAAYNDRVKKVRQKMGVGSIVVAAIQWDRWRRETSGQG